MTQKTYSAACADLTLLFSQCYYSDRNKSLLVKPAIPLSALNKKSDREASSAIMIYYIYKQSLRSENS